MQPDSLQNLKSFLDHKSLLYNSVGFIPADPISIPHLFTRKEDIEIAGFLAATLSWGQRVTIVKNSRRLMSLMELSPYEFITDSGEKEYAGLLSFVHRTFNGEDCIFFLNALRNLYIDYRDMETVFQEGFSRIGSMQGAIAHFRQSLLITPHLPRSIKHIPNTMKGSAAKRINMFLRWMVRTDDKGVDFGIWKSLSPADLMCPLDVHSGRVARKLGLLDRKQDDWRAVEELTENLRRFDPVDPVKYDYALFGLGVFERF